MSTKQVIFKIAGVYTAIILGAGFASGQELNSFFVKYGAMGFWGLVVAGVIFALVGWATLSLCAHHHISTYSAFVDLIMGKRAGAVMKLIVAAFLFTLFATMLAAAGASLHEAFHIPTYAGVLLMAFLCFTTFMFDLDGLVEINAFLAPLMVVGGIFIGIYTFYFEHVSVGSIMGGHTQSGGWLMSALTYAAYNIVTAVTVLAAMGAMVKKPHIAFWGGTLGGVAMTVLGVCLMLPLFASRTLLQGFEIPLLQIVTKHHVLLKLVYLLILLAAIYTTAVANGFAFIEAVCDKVPLDKTIVKIAVTICALAMSQIGFSTFVGTVYPLFGIFGLIEIVLILVCFGKSLSTR